MQAERDRHCGDRVLDASRVKKRRDHVSIMSITKTRCEQQLAKRNSLTTHELYRCEKDNRMRNHFIARVWFEYRFFSLFLQFCAEWLATMGALGSRLKKDQIWSDARATMI